jgi:hypothetical protein
MRVEKSGRRRLARPAQARPPDVRVLRYLVLERSTVVAAFSSRSDGELWIEECGHPAMTLQELNTEGTARPSRGGQINQQPAPKSVRRRRRDN